MITKAEKAAYDRLYRAKNRERLKRQKQDYFIRTYDPVKAAKERKKRMPQHVLYCRQKWYREYKRKYDKQYRARRLYGEFQECYLLLRDLMREIVRQEPDRFERYKQAGRFQWNPIQQQRYRRNKRDKLNGYGFEVGTLEHP